MKAKAMINAALNRAATPAQRIAYPQGSAAQVRAIIAAESASLPVAQGHDDTVMIMRSALLKREADGADLVRALDKLIMTHAGVGAAVVAAGSLGMIMWVAAVDALRTYIETGVAMAPRSL